MGYEEDIEKSWYSDACNHTVNWYCFRAGKLHEGGSCKKRQDKAICCSVPEQDRIYKGKRVDPGAGKGFVRYKKYFDQNYYIMEIKTLSSMPLWLVRSLSELKIYPTSFSKYGSIYQKNKLKKEKCMYA